MNTGESTGKILSTQDCDYILRTLDGFTYLNNEYDSYMSGMKRFDSNPIVQSFYESGNYGREIKEELDKIMTGFKKYVDILYDGNNGLIAKTREFVEAQKELLNGKVGGA